MLLSIVITTHNEGKAYLGPLLDKMIGLVQKFPERFELIVVDDFSDDEWTNKKLEIISDTILPKGRIAVEQHHLNGDFASHKNWANHLCNGEWILQLDGDEDLSEDVIFNLEYIIEANPDVEAYFFSRVNTVDGITLKHLQEYHWIITQNEQLVTAKCIDSSSAEYQLLKQFNCIITDENGQVTYYTPLIQWPDPQLRLYKNASHLRWENKVHERVVGWSKCSAFPFTLQYSIRHAKHIDRQVKQNTFYETIK